MKKLSMLTLALSVATLGTPVLAHGTPQETNQDDKKPVLMNIKGTVKADGDKSRLSPARAENPGMSSIPNSEGSRRASRRAERSRLQRQGPDPDPRDESYDALIWNDQSSTFLFFPLLFKRQRKLRSRRLLRRLITLIFAGRNRIIVIRRELPRTSGAGSVRRPTA
jgi:hypothetical protein